MGRVGHQCLLIAFVVFALLGGAKPALAAEPAEAALRSSVQELDRWLGSNSNAPGWRKFLKADQLTAELEKGARANRGVVREVLDRYSSETPGLDRKRFVAVREALKKWLETLPTWQADQLPEAARAAKPHLVLVTEADVKRERTRLATAVANLRRLLGKAKQEEAASWKETIKWEQLESQLAAADARPDLKELKSLQSVGDRYRQDIAGLEQAEFIAVREALDKYVNAAWFVSSSAESKKYEGYLDSLAEKLTVYAQEPKVEDAIAIGRTLGWLDRFGQAGELVAATRFCYSRPNLFLEFSEALMQAGIDQSVDETAAVNEVIMGTRIRGNARLTGAVTLEFIPSEENAAMDILLDGSTVSDSVGTNGPVRVFSRGLTSVAARKHLQLDATGLSDRPATAKCSTRTRIGRVEAGHLIRHIAMKRIQRTKPQTEILASRRAASRISATVDERSAELVSDANTSFSDKFRLPLVRRGGFPQLLHFRTSDDTLQVTMLEAGRDQLAAPDAPPALAGKFDLAVRMHESLAGNMSQAILGGVTLKDERLAEIIKDLTGKVPDALVITGDKDPWSITFASELPIQVRLGKQTVKIMIRGERFTRSEQEIRRPIEISADYSVEKLADGAKLVRQGDVQIVFAGRQSLSASDIAMKSFMKKTFEGLFKQEIVSEGLTLPKRWQDLGKLKLEQLACDKGWLTLGWLKPAVPPAAEAHVASND